MLACAAIPAPGATCGTARFGSAMLQPHGGTGPRDPRCPPGPAHRVRSAAPVAPCVPSPCCPAFTLLGAGLGRLVPPRRGGVTPWPAPHPPPPPLEPPGSTGVFLLCLSQPAATAFFCSSVRTEVFGGAQEAHPLVPCGVVFPFRQPCCHRTIG